MAITAAQLEVRVGADTSDAERGLQSMGTKVQGMGKSMASAGMAMTAGLTVPLVAGFAAAVSSAADFEQSLNVLAAVTDAPAEAMQMLTDQALELGASTVFSANEAAEAMLELGKAGMSTAEIGEAIGGVMDLAAAGGMELADAAGITSAALQTFGLDASESAYVANSLAAAANASSASMQDLGYGIRNAGAVMAASGVDIDTLNTLMAILTNHGLEASDAATSLKTMHMRLTAPTAKASKVMQQLGINVFDSAGNMRDYRDIIGDMTAATEGMSDEMQSMAFETVFGADAIRAANIVVQEGVEGYDEMTAAVKEQGASQRAAAAQTKGFSGAMERLGGSIDTLGKRIILPWLDSLTGVIDMVGSAIDAVSDFSPAILNLALAFGAALAAAGPLLLIGSKLLPMFAAMNPVVLAVTAAIALLAAAWATDFMGIQGAAQTAWDTVSGFFTAIPGQAQAMATAVQTAFDKTTFPTLEELWADFQAGDFATLAEKITTTAYDLMVNLDAELGISAQANGLAQILVDAVNGVANAIAAVDWSAKQTEIALHMTTLRDNVYSSLTTAITAVPWSTIGTTIQTKIDELTTTINGFTLDIDWRAFLIAIIQTPIKLAVAGLTWVFSGDDFKTLKDAVSDAIRDLGWTNIAASLEKLGTAITNQLKLLVWDIAADFGINMDTVVVDFTTVATTWRDKFLQDLIINSPAYATVATVWGKLFGNDLDAEPVDFGTTATTWGDLLKGDLQATTMDFGPWATAVVEDMTAAQVAADYGPAGTAAGNTLADAIEAVFFGAQLAADTLTAITIWSNQLGLDMRKNIIAGLEEGGILIGIDEFMTALKIDVDAFMTNMMKQLEVRSGEWSAAIKEMEMPQWITDLLTWKPVKPDWMVELSTFELTTPTWWPDLKDWKPDEPFWAPILEEWQALTPLWFYQLMDWLAKTPEWYQTLIDWMALTPEWYQTLIDWMALEPSWYATLIGWMAMEPAWYTSLINWSALKPSWLQGMLDWVANLPTWVTNLIAWVPSSASWVDNLLSWSPSMPDWVNRLLNWTAPSDEPEAEASGTPYAKGGMTWVGERGPELVNLPRGSRVWNNTQSMAMAAGAATVSIGAVHIHNDMDVEVLAATIARRIAQGGRR